MLIGYMRVSTSERSPELRRAGVERAGCERMFEDVRSGAVQERPGLSRALDQARSGDVVAVRNLDRIGRSLRHVVRPVSGLRERGVGLEVSTGETDTPISAGRLVVGLFATRPEFERDRSRERTMAGSSAARARGRRGGRPRMMTRAKPKTAMTMVADQDDAAKDVTEQFGVSPSTRYTHVDGKGRPKARAAELLRPMRSRTHTGTARVATAA